VFEKFPKYHMNILLGDLNAEVDRELAIYIPLTPAYICFLKLPLAHSYPALASHWFAQQVR
jgi:hypothetical protein